MYQLVSEYSTDQLILDEMNRVIRITFKFNAKNEPPALDLIHFYKKSNKHVGFYFINVKSTKGFEKIYKIFKISRGFTFYKNELILKK